MKKTIQTEVCTFDELTPEQQAKCLDKYRNINVEHDWYQWSIDDFTTILQILGFDGIKIGLSGFWSQGDGAHFTAERYAYAKDATKKIQEHAPNETAFLQAAKELQQIQRRHFYSITGKVVKKSHHYEHENTVECELFTSSGDWASEKTHDDFNAVIRSLMRYIYRQLEKEYQYQTSDEAVKDTIEANEYFFNPSTLEIES